jgi:hypothetical protein
MRVRELRFSDRRQVSEVVAVSFEGQALDLATLQEGGSSMRQLQDAGVVKNSSLGKDLGFCNCRVGYIPITFCILLHS